MIHSVIVIWKYQKKFLVIFQQLSLLAINITQIIILVPHLRDITEIGMLWKKRYMLVVVPHLFLH